MVDLCQSNLVPSIVQFRSILICLDFFEMLPKSLTEMPALGFKTMALSKLGRFFALSPTLHSPAAGASADGNDSQPVAVVGGETSLVGSLTEG